MSEVTLNCIPNDHLQQVEWLALHLRHSFVLRFANGFVLFDHVFQDLHHHVLLDVAQAAVVKQGLQCFGNPGWLMQLQEQLVFVCWRYVQLQVQHQVLTKSYRQTWYALTICTLCVLDVCCFALECGSPREYPCMNCVEWTCMNCCQILQAYSQTWCLWPCSSAALMTCSLNLVQQHDSCTNLGFGCLLPYNVSQQMVFGVLHFVLVHPQVLPRHWALGVAAETPPLEVDLVKGLPYRCTAFSNYVCCSQVCCKSLKHGLGVNCCWQEAYLKMAVQDGASAPAKWGICTAPAALLQ